jgi:hypothetical protein
MKFNLFIVVSFLSFILVNSSSVQATSLHEYSQTDDSTAHFGATKVNSIQLGNQTKREGLSFFSGHVELELEYFPEGKPSFTKKINVWFDRRSEAMLFEAVMKNDPALELYYDFSRNPFNWTAYSTSCRILGSFICRDSPVTAVDFNNLDGNKLWIHNRDTNRMTNADEANEAHETASLEDDVFDGNRDGNRRQPSFESDQSVSEESSVRSV